MQILIFIGGVVVGFLIAVALVRWAAGSVGLR